MSRVDWPKVGWIAVTLLLIGRNEFLAAVAWGFGVPLGYYLALYEQIRAAASSEGSEGQR